LKTYSTDKALPRVQVYLFTAGRTLYKLLQSLLRFDLFHNWMWRNLLRSQKLDQNAIVVCRAYHSNCPDNEGAAAMLNA
jgi:hypothetical protein